MPFRTRFSLILPLLAIACDGGVEVRRPAQNSTPSNEPSPPAPVTRNEYTEPDAQSDLTPSPVVDSDAVAPALDGGASSDASTSPPEVLLDPSIPVQGNAGCVPWSSVREQTFVGTTDASRSLATLNAIQAAMAGTFVGHVTSPWGDWDVVITFTSDGHYVASAYDGTTLGGTPPPFYYGGDGTTSGCESLAQWRLLDVAVTGAASGQIDVPFYVPGHWEADGGYPAQCYLPGWQGLLSQVSFDVPGNRLHFDFGTSDGYGPIVYDLWRECSAAQDGG